MASKAKSYRILSRDYIRKLGSLLSNREKIKIVPANHWATNVPEKTLYYDENALRKFNETHVLGFMLHEIGHLKNTTVVNTSTQIFEKHPSVSKDYINSFEDLRIDSIMSRRYAGSMEVIEALHEQAASYSIDQLEGMDELIKNIALNKRKADMDASNGSLTIDDRRVASSASDELENFEKISEVQKMVFAAMTIYYKNFSPFVESRILNSFKEEEHRQVVHEMAQLIDTAGLEYAESTIDCQAFFEDKIFPIIEKYLPPEESKKSQNSNGSSGQSGKGEQDLNQMNAQSSRAPSAGEEDAGNSGQVEDKEDKDGNMRPQPSISKAGNDRNAKDTTRAGRVQKALPKQDPNSDAMIASPSVGKDKGGGEADYAEARAHARGMVSNLSARMNRILRDNSFERFTGKFRSGRLKKAGLYKFMTNDTRLFTRKQSIQNKSYAFSVLIDASGSMNGTRWHESLKAVALLTDTCKKLNIPIEIIAFSSEHVIAKPFHQAIIPEFFNKNVDPILGGGTTMYPAFQEAIANLNHQKENSKFVITLTDGELDSEDQSEIPKAMAKNKHIKFYGIGIDVKLNKYFPNSVSVKDATEIPTEFAAILKQNIKRN